MALWTALLGVFGLTPDTLAEAPILDQVPAELIDPVVSRLPVEEQATTTGTTSSQITNTTMNTPPTASTTQEATANQDIRTMLVAGGCFWCVEADLEKTPGVISAVSGYAGGTTENPTYENYGDGGHREVVEVTYDANKITYEGVLIVTLKTTDPTDDNGTFGDRGDKYSPAFYYETDVERVIIENLIAEVDENGPYDQSLAIDIEARPTFWPAEEYHQDYYKGTFSKLKYQFYRQASGRSDFAAVKCRQVAYELCFLPRGNRKR